jgi:hypothetical protein
MLCLGIVLVAQQLHLLAECLHGIAQLIRIGRKAAREFETFLIDGRAALQ